MTAEDRESQRRGRWLLMLCVAVLVMLAPGMVAMAALQTATGWALDFGQMWSFATLASLAAWAIIRCVSGSMLQALGRYAVLSVLTLLALFVSVAGFKCRWPLAALSLYLPPTEVRSASFASAASHDSAQLRAMQSIVRSYMSARAASSARLRFLEWSDLAHDRGTWAVSLRYQAQAAAGSTTASVRFFVKEGVVINTQVLSQE